MYQVHKYNPALLLAIEPPLSVHHSYLAAMVELDKQKTSRFSELCIVDTDLDDDGIIHRTVPCLFVVTEAWGNPDLDEAPGRLLARKTVPVRDIAHASEVCMAYISNNGLGGGNWVGDAGNIFDARLKRLGKVSYNGKVWEPGHNSGHLPAYTPPRLAPAFPAAPPSPPPAPLFAANEERGVEAIAKGDTVVETFRGPGSVTYKVVDISKSRSKLTLHEPGHEGLVYAYRDGTGKYRVKDGGFIHKQRAS